MLEVVLAIEIMIAIALVAVILLQRSEGGALGMGGGGGGIGGLMSARGAANLLTRLTAVLATLFIGVALLLAILTGQRGDGSSVFDNPELTTPLSEDFPVSDEDLPASDDNLELPAFPEENTAEPDAPPADNPEDSEG